MSLKGQGFGQLMQSIKDWFIKANNSFDVVSDSIVSIEDTVQAAVDDIKDIKDFEFDPQWKTRVISVPALIKNYDDLKDLIVKQFTEKCKELLRAVQDIRASIENPRDPIDPSGVSGGVAVFQWIDRIVRLLTAVDSTLKTVLNLADIIDDLKQSIEKLDVIFLSQSKPRFYEKKKVYTRKP